MIEKYIFYDVDMNEKVGEIEKQDMAILFLGFLFNRMGLDNIQIQRIIVEEEVADV